MKSLHILIFSYLLISFNLITAAEPNRDTIPTGSGTIEAHLANAKDGDVFYLLNGGVYTPLATIEINKKITLRAVEIPSLPNLSNLPKINNSNALENIIHMQDSGSLTLIGIELDGQNSATRCLSFQSTDSATISMDINRCRIHDATGDIIGGTHRGTAIIKEFTIRNSFVYNSGEHGIYIKDIWTKDGVNNSPYLFEDITFWNLGQQLVWIQAYPNTSVYTYKFNHMTGWNLSTNTSVQKELIGNSDAGGQYIVDLTNSIFSKQNTPTFQPSLWFTTNNLNGNDNVITLRNLVLYDVQPDAVRDGSQPITINNKLTDGPAFTDPANGDFTIGNTNYLTAGDNGEIIGARYWHPNFVDDYSDVANNYEFDSSLDSIFVNSKLIAGYKKDRFNYIYTIPAETSIPEVTFSILKGNASVVIKDATNLNGTKEEKTTTLTVTSENELLESIYTIEFYTLSKDSTLADLTVDNTPIEGFNAETFHYLYKVASGTTQIPNVSGILSSNKAKLKIIPASNIKGSTNERTTQLIVFAEDTTAKSIYSIEFYQRSSDASLSDLTVNGTTIDGFASNSLIYFYDLPSGTETIPTVNGVTSSDSAKINIVSATKLNGTASERTTQIIVTAEEVNITSIYKILFELKTSSIVSNYSDNKLIYPTTVKNELFINHFEKANQIEIISVSGKSTLISPENNTEKIDVSFLQAGIYIIKLRSETGIYSTKFIKE